VDNNSVDSKKEGEKVEKSAQEKASDSISSKEEAAVSSESSSTIELSQGVAGANESSKSESSIKEVPVEEKVKKEASGGKEPETEKPEQKQSEKKEPVKKELKKNAPVQKKSSGSGSLVKAILVLLLLLLLAAAGGAGWWFYQLQQQEPVVNKVQQNLESQQQDIKRLEQRLDDERAERQNQQQSQAALNQSISDIQLNINSHARRLRELSTTSRSDWLLAEAEYLIRLANQRLITERNTKNATSLLVTADGILRDLDEVDLLPVRKALAKSITALRSTQMVDREGLYLQLSALSEQLVNLPLMAPELDEEVSVDVETEVTEAENGSISEEWRERIFQSFNSALESASDLIRVRRRDAPLEPLPSVEEDQQLRHNLAILLEQAQMALLREEQAIYQVSLEKAQVWLNNYFELNESAIPLVEQLALLEQENVVQQLPDISEGLEVLRDYIDSWHKRHTVQQSDEDQAGE
jgi:uroporphyrin-3 C-methyltransferase